jgi:hypothetical protein
VFLARFFDPPIVALAVGCRDRRRSRKLALQAAALARLGLMPRFGFDVRDEGVRRVLRADGARR